MRFSVTTILLCVLTVWQCSALPSSSSSLSSLDDDLITRDYEVGFSKAVTDRDLADNLSLDKRATTMKTQYDTSILASTIASNTAMGVAICGGSFLTLGPAGFAPCLIVGLAVVLYNVWAIHATVTSITPSGPAPRFLSLPEGFDHTLDNSWLERDPDRTCGVLCQLRSGGEHVPHGQWHPLAQTTYQGVAHDVQINYEGGVIGVKATQQHPAGPNSTLVERNVEKNYKNNLLEEFYWTDQTNKTPWNDWPESSVKPMANALGHWVKEHNAVVSCVGFEDAQGKIGWGAMRVQLPAHPNLDKQTPSEWVDDLSACYASLFF